MAVVKKPIVYGVAFAGLFVAQGGGVMQIQQQGRTPFDVAEPVKTQPALLGKIAQKSGVVFAVVDAVHAAIAVVV